MDTGNNTAGKTAPERYVSEKAFEELPDTFQKLAELLGEDQFELVAVNDEKDPQDQKAASESAFLEAIAEKSDDNMYRVDSYVKNGEIRLVYLMNDAVESFLVFGNARMTGVYKPDYEGEIHISTIPGDYYHYNEAACEMVGEATGRCFKLGMPVRIEVEDCDRFMRTINFRLVDK